MVNILSALFFSLVLLEYSYQNLPRNSMTQKLTKIIHVYFWAAFFQGQLLINKWSWIHQLCLDLLTSGCCRQLGSLSYWAYGPLCISLMHF